MAYLKPQNPIKGRDGDYIYPLTTVDQVIMPDGGRLNTKVLKPKAGFIYPLASANVPEGFLLCDGAAYSRTEYPELFAAIGTIYGSGDGSTTFNVPNLATRVPVGKGSGYALGATGGAASVALREANLPVSAMIFDVIPNGGWSTGTWASHGSNYAGAIPLSQYLDSHPSGQAHNNMQPYTVVNYIIATGKNTGVSVQDIITGAQAIPLGIEYGGTGATNAATALENLGGISKELLWENADLSSPFGTQTLNLNLREYERIGIDTLAVTTVAGNYFSCYYSEGFMGSRIRCAAFGSNETGKNAGWVALRNALITLDGIVFGDAGYTRLTNGENGSDNNYSIPVRIYGIRGAK